MAVAVAAVHAAPTPCSTRKAISCVPVLGQAA